MLSRKKFSFLVRPVRMAYNFFFPPLTFEELSLAKSWGSQVARGSFPLFLVGLPPLRPSISGHQDPRASWKAWPLSLSQNSAAGRPFRALYGASLEKLFHSQILTAD